MNWKERGRCSQLHYQIESYAPSKFSHPGNKDKAPVNINDIINTTVTVASHEWKYVAEIELKSL